MRHTKMTAALLAVSVFLVGCGGSTGSAADSATSGAGMTASGQEQAAGQQDTEQEQAAGLETETASQDRDRNIDAKTPISEENYSDREKQDLNALETNLAEDS